MAGIKSCIDKIKSFPKGLKSKLLALNDKFKEQGLDDVDAGTEAVLVIHKELHEELNDLKRQVGQKIDKYKRPKTEEGAIQEKYSKIDKQRAFESAQKEREKEEEIKKAEAQQRQQKESIPQPKNISQKVYDVPLSEIKTNEKEYQGRKNAYSEKSAKKVAEQFDPNKFDPIVVYKHPDGNTYVLSGHSRFAGMKMRNAETVPARYFEGTPEEAIDFAQNSNKLGDLQTDLENANYYRGKIQKGVTRGEILKEAKENEQRGSAQRVVDFAYLNPEGKAYDAVSRLEESEGDSGKIVQNVAQKIGRLRSFNDHLTDAHENELFDYFMKEGPPTDLEIADDKFYVNKSINSVKIDPSEPLNLSKFTQKSQERIDWENQRDEYESEIKRIKKLITPDKTTGWTPLKENVINRIKKGNTTEAINEAESNFNNNKDGIKDTYNRLLDTNKQDLKTFQDKLAKHLLKEQSVLEGERNQGQLFEPKPKYNQSTINFENEEVQIESVSDKDLSGPNSISEAEVKTFQTIKGVWQEFKHLSFSGKEKVKNHADVAYIMRLLEDKNVEHAFAVHVDKDGNSFIQFLSIGGISGTVIDGRVLLSGVNEFSSKKVYLVHNHPSGNLNPSDQDITLSKSFYEGLAKIGVSAQHVIMNGLTGEYALIDSDLSVSKQKRESSIKDEKQLKVHQLGMKQTLSEPIAKVKDAESAARAIQSLQYSALPKHGALILDSSNSVVGNSVLSSFSMDDVGKAVSVNPTAVAVILYGNQSIKAAISDISKTDSGLNRLSIKVLDYIAVSPSPDITESYESAANIGLLADTQEKYSTNIVSEPKSSKKQPLTDKQKKIKQLYEAIKDIEDVSAVPYEDMVDAYNYVITDPEFSRTETGKGSKKEFVKRMGMNFFQRYSDKLKTDPKFSKEGAAKTDIKGYETMMKHISHFSAVFPELRGLYELFSTAAFNKATESAEKRHTNLVLAKAVIKDAHKRMGLGERAVDFVKNLLGNRNYKYFDFLEGKDGNFITVSEAEKKGYSKAQIEYLKFARNVVAARAKVVDNLKDNWDNDIQLLKNDKRFFENLSTENAVTAFSALLGNTWNINNTRIKFTNPATGKEQEAEYEQVEKIISKYAEKGILQKAKALVLIAKYNMRAKAQLATNVNVDEKGSENVLNPIRSGDFSISQTGRLTSKFDKPRDPKRPYSKDFFSAINEYIDDTEHIQHFQPLVPIIAAIEHINTRRITDSEGNLLHDIKPNVAEWLKEWYDMKITKKKAKTVLGKFDAPVLGEYLRLFRYMASASMMMGNVEAQTRNVIQGVYNQWRKEAGKDVAIGFGRFFGGKPSDRKLNIGYGVGTLNPYAIELIKKFKIVSTDIDSNPIRTAGGAISALGYAGTKWGEFLVQGTHWLGLLDEKDYNSFEWKKNKFGVDELVFKPGVDQEAIKRKFLDARTRVSDVQGKYSAEDARNIQNNELGKSIMQFRVWLPDWWRIRFSKDAGSWRNMILSDSKKMREAIAKDGVIKAFWNDKNFMSNLKEVAMIVFLTSLLYTDDEDEEKSLAAEQGQKVLSEMIGVVDFEQQKVLLEKPIASVGVVTRLLDAFDHLIMLEADDFYKKDSKYGKEGDPKIIGDIKSVTPGKKFFDTADEFSEDENE